MAKRRSIQWDDAGSTGENARAQLPAVAGAYFRAGRKLLRPSRSTKQLHDFRLKTKRLRYTLELFRGCYGPALDKALEELRELQTILGEINDCQAALDLAANSLPAGSPEFLKLNRYLQARSARLRTVFRKHWREKFDAAGREDWWTGHLARKR